MKKIIVVGGGAAGMLAAGTAARRGLQVTVVEHMERTCKKILVTGKGRCNVTNDCDPATVLKNVRGNPKFLYSALNAFTPADTMALMESLGVPLKTERGRRVFPVSDRAADIADALARYAGGCKVVFGEARAVTVTDGAAAGVLLADGRLLAADGVLLATGGLSYPGTGSTGGGYRMARELGHSVVPTTASLVALTAAGPARAECRAMMGLSLRNMRLTLLEGDKPLYAEQGEMLFTHFGISGPLVLSASAYLRTETAKETRAVIDLKPALDEPTLYARVNRDFEKFANRDAANSLSGLLPAGMVPVILARWGVPPDKKVNQITREERRRLTGLLKGFEVPISGKDAIERAVVTAGGVSVREVSPRTMESKLVKNLHFAGELLDVDAYTGGYNLQIAFSTGYAAGTHILEEK
ncbi:NAD(P)/FAD-dependent oxidoreductase [Anaerofilum sp. BX8]|uniref:NAD(P)/FAD-dependent oxidoreductase n=1 Tax=Anaerofilum hominis TaxID=2763016 RepID=A0A923I8R1_9FIRM|nr:NAD(P)/FAD-dependent oxidoreductase [Anaerofilum hominis]